MITNNTEIEYACTRDGVKLVSIPTYGFDDVRMSGITKFSEHFNKFFVLIKFMETISTIIKGI